VRGDVAIEWKAGLDARTPCQAKTLRIADMNHARSHPCPRPASLIRAAAVCLAALAGTSCAGTAAPVTPPPILPSALPETSPPAGLAPTPTYPGEPDIIPPETAATGPLEFVEPVPPAFDSIVYALATDSLLLAGDTSGTLSLFSLDDPAKPRFLSQIQLGLEPYREFQVVLNEMAIVQRTHAVEIRAAVLDGNRLYVMTKSMLHVLDWSDPSSLVPLGSLSIGPRLNDLRLSDGSVSLVVADTFLNGLRLDVVDARDPSSMQVISQTEFPGTTAARARIEGEIVYVTDREMTAAPDLALYSLADPARPAFIGTIPDLPAFRAWLDGSRIYIATAQLREVPGLGLSAEQAAVQIADLSDPSQPVLGKIPLPDLAQDLWIESGRACVLAWQSDGTPALFLVDVQSPEQPQVLAEIALWGEPQMVTCSADHAYIAAGSAGLLVVDLNSGAVVAALTAADLPSP